MRVSIAMTTCNGARHVAEQLASFVAQTRRPDELVICDDASEDGTPALLEAFKARAPFSVRVIVNPVRLGVSANVEQAMAACSGDVIFLSDQDDAWDAEKAATMCAALERAPDIGIAIHDARIADGDLRPLGPTLLRQTMALTGTDREYIHGCCSVLRREFRDLCLPLPREEGVAAGFDGWLHEAGWILGRRLVVPEVLQSYRRHGANVSHSQTYAARPQGLAGHLGYLLDRLKAFTGDAAGHARQLSRTLDRVRLLRERMGGRATPQLAAREAMLTARLAMTRKTRLARIPATLALYRGGGYDLASGAKSMVVDLLKARDREGGL